MAYTDREVYYLRQMETLQMNSIRLKSINRLLLAVVDNEINTYGCEFVEPNCRRDSLGRIIGVGVKEDLAISNDGIYRRSIKDW